MRQQRPAIPVGLFSIWRLPMDQIPLAAAVIVKALLEWWLED
jgi:hypothetical protein